MAADALAIKVAGKVAAGATEALNLAFGPGRRLMTITLEATRNVVEHAYAGRDIGDVELRIGLNEEDVGPDSEREVFVCVRDFGWGCPLTPTSSDPPGLGLSIMSELSEGLAIRSLKDGGTEIGASLRLGRSPIEAEARIPSRVRTPVAKSELGFGDPAFLLPVLPRAMAAHAVAMDGSMEAVGETILRGQKIAHLLARSGGPPTISLIAGEGAESLEVHVGALSQARADALLSDFERELGTDERARIEVDSDLEPSASSALLLELSLH